MRAAPSGADYLLLRALRRSGGEKVRERPPKRLPRERPDELLATRLHPVREHDVDALAQRRRPELLGGLPEHVPVVETSQIQLERPKLRERWQRGGPHDPTPGLIEEADGPEFDPETVESADGRTPVDPPERALDAREPYRRHLVEPVREPPRPVPGKFGAERPLRPLEPTLCFPVRDVL